MTDRFITTSEVADLLNVTPKRLRQWRVLEFGPKFIKRDESGKVLYYFESVMAFIQEGLKDLDYLKEKIKKSVPRLVKRATSDSGYIRRASDMPTPFKYDIGLDNYHDEYEHSERAQLYNEKAQNC